MSVITMQRPRAGCDNCGGPVRSYKRHHGWTCAKCVRQLDQDTRR